MSKRCYVGIIRTPSGWQKFAGCDRAGSKWNVMVRFGTIMTLEQPAAVELASEMAARGRDEDCLMQKAGKRIDWIAYPVSLLKDKAKVPASQAIDAARLVDPGDYTLDQAQRKIAGEASASGASDIEEDGIEYDPVTAEERGKQSLKSDYQEAQKNKDKTPVITDADPNTPCSPNIKRWIAKWVQNKTKFLDAKVQPDGVRVIVTHDDRIIKIHEDDQGKIEQVIAKGKTGLRFYKEEWDPGKPALQAR